MARMPVGVNESQLIELFSCVRRLCEVGHASVAGPSDCPKGER